MAQLTEYQKLQYAWAAGFIDGEGHFGVHRIKDGRSGNERVYRLHPRVIVGQVLKPPLEEMKNLFGGWIYQRKKATENNRAFYAWELNGAKASLACIRAVQPYLRVKGPEANALALICERIVAWPIGQKLTTDEIEARNDLSESLTIVRSHNTGRGAITHV